MAPDLTLADDDLNPARGIVLALALCLPFWVALVALLYRSVG